REPRQIGRQILGDPVRGLWGKKSRKKVIAGREAYPLHGRYTPRLMVTGRDSRHDNVRAVPRAGTQDPWNTVWARRALGRGGVRLHGVSDAAIADLTRAFLKEGRRQVCWSFCIGTAIRS